MQRSKLNGYLGLCKRSNSILYGFDNIKASKNCFLVLISSDCKENLERRVSNICAERNIKIKKLNATLNEILNTNNCSVVGIINKNFVEPILKCEGRNGWLLVRFSSWSLHHSNFAFDFVAVPQIS